MSAEPVFVSVSARGTISLPAAMRRRLHLDQPGAQVAVSLDEVDNVIRLEPYQAIRADQAWFWTPEWQAGEREATEQLRRGQGTFFGSDEEFTRWLETH